MSKTEPIDANLCSHSDDSDYAPETAQTSSTIVSEPVKVSKNIVFYIQPTQKVGNNRKDNCSQRKARSSGSLRSNSTLIPSEISAPRFSCKQECNGPTDSTTARNRDTNSETFLVDLRRLTNFPMVSLGCLQSFSNHSEPVIQRSFQFWLPDGCLGASPSLAWFNSCRKEQK
jgi:hypothetical protein